MGKRTQEDIDASERLSDSAEGIQFAENIEHRIRAKVLDFSVVRGHHEGLKDGSEVKIKIGAEQAHICSPN